MAITESKTDTEQYVSFKTEKLAYGSDEALKAEILRLVKWHQEQDRLIKGSYWEGNGEGKGCAVGCTLESTRRALGMPAIRHNSHALYETLLGVPRVLARLEDGLFERLDQEHSQEWPLRFLEAIPVGADLSLVWPRFAVWLLTDETDGVIRYAERKEGVAAIQGVSDLYNALTAGEQISRRQFGTAAYAAYAAAAADADAAADDDAARVRQAEKLLQLLRETEELVA